MGLQFPRVWMEGKENGSDGPLQPCSEVLYSPCCQRRNMEFQDTSPREQDEPYDGDGTSPNEESHIAYNVVVKYRTKCESLTSLFM